MLPLVLDRASRANLDGQIEARKVPGTAPLRWHAFLDEFSRTVTGIGAVEDDWRAALAGRAILFSWQMSPETVAIALAGRPFVFMCWGIAQLQFVKSAILSIVLKRAMHVLVNDAVTEREVLVHSGRSAVRVPFFIDTDFFSYAPPIDRGDFYFCNGVNDRDPGLLLGLAERGCKIVWLANDSQLRDRYTGRHPNLELKSGLSFPELRLLYQSCMASIMPASKDAHCAGQTTCMEAIACGAPVLMSAGRTAGIFVDLPSVEVLDGNDPDEWALKLAGLRRDPDEEAKTKSARSILERRLTKESMYQYFAPHLGWNVDGGEANMMRPVTQ